ncbi:MAG: formate dehydrogenase accessory sulfurtransferase FdhD [Pseudomonadota bacterium]
MTALFRENAAALDVALQPVVAQKQPSDRSVLRHLAEEVPVALVFDGASAGVMMASPTDIRDLAFGFALTEGIVSELSEVKDFEEVSTSAGIEARIWLKRERSVELAKRRRLMAGPVGCGLCGIDSLEQAMRRISSVGASDLRLSFQTVKDATESLRSHQPLHDQTGSTHAAGFLVPDKGILFAREDVGRHNALDKLIGTLAQHGISPASGAFVMTSRISVELVQKSAVAGCGMIIAVSAPTSHAVKSADEAGITLAAFARGHDFEVFTHAFRIEAASK